MNNPLIYLLNRMWHYSKGSHKKVVFYVALSTGANLLMAVVPLIVGLLLNNIQINGVQKENIVTLLLTLLLLPAIEFGFWAMHGSSRMIENQNAFWVRKNYKNYLLGGTMALPMEWHADHHSGDTIDKIEKGTTALYSFSERTFEIIEGIILLSTSFGAMLFYDRLAGYVAIFICFLTFYILTLYDKKLVPGYKLVSKMENATSAKIFDALSNITTIIILRMEPLILKSLDSFIKKPFTRFNQNNKINELKWFTASIFGVFTVVIVVGIYLITHLNNGPILVGTVYILYSYAGQIRNTFFKFAYLYNDIVRYRASVSNTEELSKDFLPDDASQDKYLPKNWQVLKIQNLSFSYSGEKGRDLHLENISLDLKKGQRIALIGESGGGKTTFLKVLRDLYHPQSLKLSVDGRSVSGFSDISGSISLVPQDPEIFATTIRENITLGVEYTDEHIKIFTDIAVFSDVVNRLPKGLESSIVEKGVNLSGGEKQRLALVRGLLASENKEIILMDEPTSSVDFNNELEIFKNVFESFPQKTIISSVHRLHLLSLFDQVYFFDSGKIIASGTLDELKKTSPDFMTLWEKYLKSSGN